MIIHSLPDEHAPELSAREQGNSSQQKAKWLYELERAQWQKQRMSNTQHQNTPQPSETETENVMRNDPTSHIICGSESDIEVSNNALQASHTMRNDSLHQFKTPYVPVAGNASNDSVAAPVFAPILRTPLGVAMPADRIEPMTTGLGALAVDRRWEKQHAHMQETDAQLSLWLRDTRIDENQGIRLAFALRKRFAELGKHLAQFTLNGKFLQLEPKSIQSNPPT